MEVPASQRHPLPSKSMESVLLEDTSELLGDRATTGDGPYGLTEGKPCLTRLAASYDDRARGPERSSGGRLCGLAESL